MKEHERMESHKIIDSPRGSVHYWVWINTNVNAKCIVFTHGLSRPYKEFTYEHTAEELKTILEVG